MGVVKKIVLCLDPGAADTCRLSKEIPKKRPHSKSEARFGGREDILHQKAVPQGARLEQKKMQTIQTYKHTNIQTYIQRN